ncbi:hypothetical protein BRW65_29300, partial [Mycobacterium paraffinicum]
MISHRMSALIAGACAAYLAAAAAASPDAQAAVPDRYAVIAYSPVTGWTGWENNGTTMAEATHIALGSCQVHGAGCTVAAWARNGCAALALGSGQWGGHWGPTPAAAQNAALAMVSD